MGPFTAEPFRAHFPDFNFVWFAVRRGGDGRGGGSTADLTELIGPRRMS